MAGLLALPTLLKSLPAIIGAVAAFSAGVAACHFIDAHTIFGSGHKLAVLESSLAERDKINRDDGAKQQSLADAPAFAEWAAKLASAEKTIDNAGDSIAKAEASASTQASAAYKLGRATCGTAHAPSPVSSVPADPHAGAGRVPDADGTDFSDLFAAGAYTPGGSAVPAGGVGPPNPGAAPAQGP